MLDESFLLPTLVPSDPAAYLEQSIYFSQAVSPNNPGFLTLDNQPWMRQPLRDVLDPTVRELTLCTGA